MVPELNIGAPEGARTGKMSECGKVVPPIFGHTERVCSVSRGVPTFSGADSIVFGKFPARFFQKRNFRPRKNVYPPPYVKNIQPQIFIEQTHMGGLVGFFVPSVRFLEETWGEKSGIPTASRTSRLSPASAAFLEANLPSKTLYSGAARRLEET